MKLHFPKMYSEECILIRLWKKSTNKTLSAVPWFIANNVDISCFELSTMEIGDNHFIDINRLLPPPALEDFYDEIDDKKRHVYSEKKNTAIVRAPLLGMNKLFGWGIIKCGDVVIINNRYNSDAKVVDV